MNPGGQTTPRRQSFFCLLTFLAYLLLPLAHQWDLASQARCCPCHPHPASETAGKASIALPSTPIESRHHHHDPSTCPLCQAALGPCKLVVTFGATIVPAPKSGQYFYTPEPATVISCCSYFLFVCRAPPKPFLI